jgi:hypothetical protein
MPGLHEVQDAMVFEQIALATPASLRVFMVGGEPGAAPPAHVTTYDVVGAWAIARQFFLAYWDPYAEPRHLATPEPDHLTARAEHMQRALCEKPEGTKRPWDVPMFRTMNARKNGRSPSAELAACFEQLGLLKQRAEEETHRRDPDGRALEWTMANLSFGGASADVPLEAQVLPSVFRAHFFPEFIAALNRLTYDTWRLIDDATERDSGRHGAFSRMSRADFLKAQQHFDWFLAKMELLDIQTHHMVQRDTQELLDSATLLREMNRTTEPHVRVTTALTVLSDSQLLMTEFAEIKRRLDEQQKRLREAAVQYDQIVARGVGGPTVSIADLLAATQRVRAQRGAAPAAAAPSAPVVAGAEPSEQGATTVEVGGQTTIRTTPWAGRGGERGKRVFQ